MSVVGDGQPFEPVPLSEFIAEGTRHERERWRRLEWGDAPNSWVLKPENLTLVPTAEPDYYIDVEQLTTSAKVLDWIFQIHGKAWATPQLQAALIDALYDIVDPQANLCSMGAECGPFDVATRISEQLTAAQEPDQG